MTAKDKPMVEGKQALKNFDNLLTDVLKVPHSEIKAKLDAEKREKKDKRTQRSERGGKSNLANKRS